MKWEGGGERDVRKRKRKMKGIETFPTVISKALETDMTIHNKQVPQSHNIYHYATETQFLTSENTNLLFSVFITLTQNFWVWVMKTTLGNQAKQQNLCESKIALNQTGSEFWMNSLHFKTQFFWESTFWNVTIRLIYFFSFKKCFLPHEILNKRALELLSIILRPLLRYSFHNNLKKKLILPTQKFWQHFSC